jgi:hypothetical protein
MERFGVNLPSLDSVLSFKIDGLDRMLPIKKVIFQFNPLSCIVPRLTHRRAVELNGLTYCTFCNIPHYCAGMAVWWAKTTGHKHSRFICLGPPPLVIYAKMELLIHHIMHIMFQFSFF